MQQKQIELPAEQPTLPEPDPIQPARPKTRKTAQPKPRRQAQPNTLQSTQPNASNMRPQREARRSTRKVQDNDMQVLEDPFKPKTRVTLAADQ